MMPVLKQSVRVGPTGTISKPSRRFPLPVIIRALEKDDVPLQRLSSGSGIVGAGAGADIVIADNTVSRRHAHLELVPEGVLIRDLGSRNGTFYLGQRVGEIVVAPGASIRFGTAEVRIDADPHGLVANDGGPAQYGAMTAASPAMRKLFALLERLEGSLVNVLIEGESGTGKELIAQAIHEHSAVSSGPFIAVNCGALEGALVKSELFGHRRGAFTGAMESRVGAFEAASGGTLFLDEIGELPADVQPMLLRALETRTIVRVGENDARPIKVRVVAATHRELAHQVQLGEFREDLFYRLMVVRLKVPALRERPEDVRMLAEHFVRQAGASELPEAVIKELERYDWPGNVRQLRHAVQSYLAVGVLNLTGTRSAAHGEAAAFGAVTFDQPYHHAKEQVVEAFTRAYLTQLLGRTGGNVSEAARLSGLERSYLNKLARRLGVK